MTRRYERMTEEEKLQFTVAAMKEVDEDVRLLMRFGSRIRSSLKEAMPDLSSDDQLLLTVASMVVVYSIHHESPDFLQLLESQVLEAEKTKEGGKL